jgi:hypothetical protein
MAEKGSKSPVLFWILAAGAALVALPLLLLGAIFVLSAFHPEAVAAGKMAPRLIVGGLMLVPGILVVLLAVLLVRYALKAASATSAPAGPGVQGIPGKLAVQAVTCPHCGGQVDPSSAKLNPEGTLSLSCGYCKGVFLVHEDPQW